MAFREPLELQYWLVNVLSGSTLIFTMISLIAISSLAAYFRMSNTATLMMLMLFGLMMSAFLGNWLVIIIIVIGGMVTFWGLSKITKT